MSILLFLVYVSLITEVEKYSFPPRFASFSGISGPRAHHYFSRYAREVILMGPWTGNARKTGKTWRKSIIFVLSNQNSLKLKKVVYTTV